MKNSDPVILMRDVSELEPYKNNSRTHSAEQIKEVAASINEFGFTNPVLVRQNTIVAGHCRVLAAQSLSIKKVPTISLEGLSEIQAQAYIIADNKLAEKAGWDKELLHSEITDLQKHEFKIDLLGFEDDELQDIILDDGKFTPSIKDESSECEGWNIFKLQIICKDEDEQQELFLELRDRGFKVKA